MEINNLLCKADLHEASARTWLPGYQLGEGHSPHPDITISLRVIHRVVGVLMILSVHYYNDS